MSNKLFFNLLLFLIIALLGCQQNKEYSNNRPNFLLITTDNLGYGDLGVYGSEIATPNIDELAQKGFQFTNFHTHAQDQLNRAMLLTGTSKSLAENISSLKENTQNIAQLLKNSGYRTFMTGKWNLGQETLQLPISKGFDKSFTVSEEVSGHLGNKRFLPALFKEGVNIQEVSDDFYSTQYFARKMQSFLSDGKKKEKRKPFFAYLSFTAPNAPLQASFLTIEQQKGKYDNGYQTIYGNRLARQQEKGLLGKNTTAISLPNWESLSPEQKAIEARKMEIYAAMIQDMDKQIGRLIDYLKVSKQYQNTIIIFLSDNGILEQKINQSLAQIDNSFENMGQANSLIDLGEGWVKVKKGNSDLNQAIEPIDIPVKAPLIIHSPIFNIRKNSRIESVKTVLDLTPTILDFAEVTHPSENYFEETLPMEGTSFRLTLLKESMK